MDFEEDFIPEWQQNALDLAKRRAGERSLTESDLVANVTFISFRQTIEGPNKQKTITDVFDVPAPRKIPKKDGSGSFPANLEINCSIDSLREVPNACVTLNENAWSVFTKISYSNETTLELKKIANDAWQVDGNPDADTEFYARCREYVSQDGVLLEDRMRKIERGTKVLFKVYDSNTSIYRAKYEKAPHRPKVRRYVKLKLTQLDCQEYVSIKEEKDVKRLSVYFSIKVDGQTIISEDDDSRYGETEQLHIEKNPHAHQLVPIERVRDGTASIPASVYFYLRNMVTPYNRNNIDPHAEGVTIIRLPGEIGNFYKKDGDAMLGKFNTQFMVIQWRGKNPMSIEDECEQYHIKVLSDKNDPDQWLSFGITNVNAYAHIMYAHSNTDRDKQNLYVPLHLELTFWSKSSLSDKNNDPEQINNRKDLSHMRGYLLFSASSVIPDYLRYFRTNGLQVSQKFVEEEFATWIETKEVKNVTKRTITLEQRDETGEVVKDSTLRQTTKTFLSQDVVPMGNGKFLFPNASEDEDSHTYGKYHAFTGKTSELLDGSRDFFVLMSYTPNAQEIDKYYPPRNRGPADEFVNSLKTRDLQGEFFYWIFAVKRDAPLSNHKNYSTARLPPTHANEKIGEKRGAPEDLDDESGSRAKIE